MDAFLVGAPENTYKCNSINELHQQFATLRESKVTETKAQHLDATFELSSTTTFHVPEEPEKDVQNLDPARGSPSATPEPVVNDNAERPIRTIRAHDALMNQPADDPALQRAVAKFIIASLGAVDSTSWSVRTMSRNASGWIFQYICKNSTLAWTRQNAKGNAHALIAESSGKDGQDPINLARPAFDCRGSITIAFVKNTRKITVKLEHTPIHKTVAELAEIFKPAPPPTKAVASGRKVGGSKKKKTSAVNGESGEAGPKTKKRKKSSNEPTAEGQAPKPKKPRRSRAKPKSAAGKAPAAGAEDVVLNLSGEETQRRKEEAQRKLSDNGIDPATLSQEQFDIFANQSPELQHESLAMLIKYGAERLRIVHPSKDTGSSATPAATNGGTAEGSGKKKKKKKSSKQSLNPDGSQKIKKTRGSCQACRAKKLKCSKAKPECDECVTAGLECYYPPEQKRKPKSDEVAEEEPDAPDAPDAPVEPAAPDLPGVIQVDLTEQIPVATSMPEPEPEATPDEEASDLGSPGFNSAQAAPPELADATTFPEVSHGLYQAGTSGLSYPATVQDDMTAGMDYSQYANQLGQQQAAQSDMAYPHHPQQTTNASYADPPSAPLPAPEPEPVRPMQTPVPPPAQPPAQPPAPPAANSSRAGARRSLPSGSVQNNNGYLDSANTSSGSAWHATNAPVSTSQAYATPASPRQSRSGRNAAPVAASVYDTSQNEALAAAAMLSKAALQGTQSSPTTRTVSPFQNPTQAAVQAARAKSRQGHRAQSRATASPFQQTPPTQSTAVETASIYNSGGSAAPSNNSNYDQYPRYNTAGNQSGQAGSRGTYETYPSSAHSTNPSTTTSYAGYDMYGSRSQPSNKPTPLAAPVTQGASSPYTKTATASNTNWSNTTGHRSSNSYGSNNAAASSNSTYHVPAASTQQQQSASMQSFNVRPQSGAPTSRTNTPSSYSAQNQSTQQSRQQQQQQSYNSYAAQPTQSPSTQQPSPAQQPDWYGFAASNSAAPGYGSGSRGAGYGQSAQPRPAAMNISGNTYQSIHDQEIYDMFRQGQGQ